MVHVTAGVFIAINDLLTISSTMGFTVGDPARKKTEGPPAKSGCASCVTPIVIYCMDAPCAGEYVYRCEVRTRAFSMQAT